MPRYVIDTNVPIVANGTDQTVSDSCRLKAVELLQKAISKGKIYLDLDNVMLSEYRTHLNARGQPGVGDRFYLEVLNSHPDRVERVCLGKRADGQYEDLPQAVIDAGFDPSDRVFAAVEKKAKARVYNAVDTDWLDHRVVLESNGIDVAFVCGVVSGQWRK